MSKSEKISAKTPGAGNQQLPVWIIYLLPSMLIFAIFTFYPFLKTFFSSFFATTATGDLTAFVGAANYTALAKDPKYIQILGNTLIFMILTVPLTVIISLLLAVLSYEDLPGMGIFRTIFSSTMGISVAAGSVFWSLIFHPTAGVLNRIVALFSSQSIGWLTDQRYALIAVSIVTIWKNLGFSYLILMGGLKNIDDSHYESVEIVGGGFLFKLMKVTVPLVSPSLFFVLTTSLIEAFKTFGIIDMLTAGGPNNSTNLLVYRIYMDAFVNFRIGPACAEGVVLFILVLLVSQLQTKLTERLVTYQ